MGQSNSRFKGQQQFGFPPGGYYAPPFPNVAPQAQYGQFGMMQPVQPMNPHVVVPYNYMPQPQLSQRRKKRRNGAATSHSTRRRRNTEPAVIPPERAGSARFSESENPSSNPIRRAQTPFHRATHLEEEEEEEEEEEVGEERGPESMLWSEGSVRRYSEQVPMPPPIKEFSPREPNPLPLPPRDIFESEEYKAAVRGPGTAALLAAVYPPKETRQDNQPQRSRTGLFGKKSKGGGLFRSLTGTKKKKEDDRDLAMGNSIRFFPIPVGANDYGRLTTPSVSGAPTTVSADPTFPHPPPGVASSAPPLVVPFVAASAGGTTVIQQRPPPAPAPLDSMEPLFFSQTHPDYGGFLPHSQHRIEYEGQIYKSATHLHEALKYPDHPQVAAAIRAANSLTDIFHIATSNADRARPDWPQKFVEIMEWVLIKKFEQHPNLRALLLLTGNRPLVYAEERDNYWGDGVGVDADGNRKQVPSGYMEGANELGHMLMRIRDKLRLESPDVFHQ